MIPVYHLDVLFNMPWSGVVVLHNEIEKINAVFISVGDIERSQRLEISSDTVLLLGLDLGLDDVLNQQNKVDRGQIVLVSPVPVDARNNVSRVFDILVWTDWLEENGDLVQILAPAELD